MEVHVHFKTRNIAERVSKLLSYWFVFPPCCFLLHFKVRSGPFCRRARAGDRISYRSFDHLIICTIDDPGFAQSVHTSFFFSASLMDRCNPLLWGLLLLVGAGFAKADRAYSASLRSGRLLAVIFAFSIPPHSIDVHLAHSSYHLRDSFQILFYVLPLLFFGPSPIRTSCTGSLTSCLTADLGIPRCSSNTAYSGGRLHRTQLRRAALVSSI